jgi:hypothetical protein
MNRVGVDAVLFHVPEPELPDFEWRETRDV